MNSAAEEPFVFPDGTVSNVKTSLKNEWWTKPTEAKYSFNFSDPNEKKEETKNDVAAEKETEHKQLKGESGEENEEILWAKK